MSLVRELHHRLREAVRAELRREDAIVRDDGDEQDATGDEAADRTAVEQGPEVPDVPLGVPAEPFEGPPESPGFPRGDPTQG